VDGIAHVDDRVGDRLALGIDAEIIIEDMNRDSGQECADF
jgi:hypothetical protein